MTMQKRRVEVRWNKFYCRRVVEKVLIVAVAQLARISMQRFAKIIFCSLSV